MSEKLQTTCDGPNCGIAKKETNHWFVVALFGRVEDGTPPHIAILSHESKHFLKARAPKELADCCGENCLSRVVQTWAEKRYLEALEKATR